MGKLCYIKRMFLPISSETAEDKSPLRTLICHKLN